MPRGRARSGGGGRCAVVKTRAVAEAGAVQPVGDESRAQDAGDVDTPQRRSRLGGAAGHEVHPAVCE